MTQDGNCLGTPLGEQVGKFLGYSRGPKRFVNNGQYNSDTWLRLTT